MSRDSYSNYEVIAPPGTVNATIRRTKAIFVQTAGTVAVGSPNSGGTHNGAVVNFGSLVAGTILDIEVTTVGSATTATIIAMR